MKVDILNTDGKKTGKDVNLPASIFGVETKEHVLYLAVKEYLANQRQGTHKSKERGEIAGSTKKIKKQKGTGTARFGDIKNPIFRGGGRIFGPKPRVYNQTLTKKTKQLARKMALSLKAKEQQIIVLDQMTMDSPSTKNYVQIMKNLGLADSKTLLVLPESNSNVLLSSRNLNKTSVEIANTINTYSVMNADKIVLVGDAVGMIEQTFNSK